MKKVLHFVLRQGKVKGKGGYWRGGLGDPDFEPGQHRANTIGTREQAEGCAKYLSRRKRFFVRVVPVLVGSWRCNLCSGNGYVALRDIANRRSCRPKICAACKGTGKKRET